MKIALVSDTHVAARAHAFNANLRLALAWIRERWPDLIVHLGDITADGMYDSAEFDFAASMLAESSLPVRSIPGNHDIGDNPSVHGARADHPFQPARLRDYRRILGADWWSLEAGAWQIIGLNAMLFATGHEDEERQFDWLAERLKEADGPLGLMLHKPLFRDGPNEREAHDRYVPWAARTRLLGMLGTRDLRLVISGHTHQARRLTVGSVEHIWLPSTSFCIPDAVQERIGEKIVGVGMLELAADGYQFELATPPELIRNNLLEQVDVYPEVTRLRAKLDSAERQL
jgi:3',5'-cyclic AMP phosphodiesterase CpdA